MSKIFKKKCVMFFLLLLLVVVMAGSTLNASAAPPTPYDFGTWTGSETISATIEYYGHTRFAKLRNSTDNKEVAPSSYTISGTDNSTVITLKEDYLKTLSNGEYSFACEFSERPAKYPFDLRANAQMFGIEDVDHTTFFKLTRGDEEIDPSNYTVITTRDSITITFKDEYLDSLTGEEDSFYIYFMMKDQAVLDLTVDVQTDSSETSSKTSSGISSTSSRSTSSAVSSTPSTDSVSIPETGKYTPIAVWLIIMLLSVVGCAVAVIIRKDKKGLI